MRRTEQGLNVPDDLSIIGFDDIPFASISNPALSTFAVPYERMGQMACAMLIGQLATGSLAAPVSVAVRLMLRSTTTPRTGSRS